MNLQYLYTKALYQHIFYSQVLHDSYLSKQLIVSASGYFFASLIHSLLMLCFHENTSTLHPLSRAVTAHLGKLVSHSDLPFIPSPVANTSIPGVSSQRAWILNSFHQENVLEVLSTLFTTSLLHKYHLVLRVVLQVQTTTTRERASYLIAKFLTKPVQKPSSTVGYFVQHMIRGKYPSHK